MTVSLVRWKARLHRTHRVAPLPVFGALYGCVNCWRVVGFRCGDITFSGQQACRPNPEIVALAEHYWRKAREEGEAGAERVVADFRAALRGRGNDLSGVGEPRHGGGRHAARG